MHMFHGSVPCLLNRLQQLNALDAQGFNIFGFTNEKPPPPPKPELDKSKFINLMTVEEIAEIEDLKKQITACLKEIDAMQVQAFEKQKEITKRCYDIFSKYRAVGYDVRGIRKWWFGMNCMPRHSRYGFEITDAERKKFEERDTYMPKDWEEKCKNGREKEQDDIKKWNDYVDGEWDAAYDHAFGVTNFRDFIKTQVPRMINIDYRSSKAIEVEHTWYELWDETKYFQEKTMMFHIKMVGNLYVFINDDESMKIAHNWSYGTNEKVGGLADPESMKIVDAFVKKTKELLELTEKLWQHRESGWFQRWDGKNDSWINYKLTLVDVRKQPTYVVPRPVRPHTND